MRGHIDPARSVLHEAVPTYQTTVRKSSRTHTSRLLLTLHRHLSSICKSTVNLPFDPERRLSSRRVWPVGKPPLRSLVNFVNRFPDHELHILPERQPVLRKWVLLHQREVLIRTEL